MTNTSIFPSPQSFNLHGAKANDPEFWADFDVWQNVKNGSAADREMAWCDLMRQRVSSVLGVLAKLEAAREMPADAIDREACAAGFSYRDILGFDVEALAKVEMIRFA
jgi:hypothetical protein